MNEEAKTSSQNHFNLEPEMFKALTDNSNDGILMGRGDGLITYANEALHEMFGYDYESREMIGMMGPECWPEEILPLVETEIIPAAMTSGWTGEVPQKRKDGSTFAASVTAFPVEDNEGEKTHMATIVRDITARKEAEEQIQESQQRLALMVEQTPLAVIEWDLDFQVVAWNPAAEEIFGYTAEEAMGHHAAELMVPEEARPLVNQVWESLLEQEGGTRSTNANFTKDGREIMCEWYNAPMVDTDGEVIGVSSMVSDITARKEAEEERERLQQEIIDAQKRAIQELSTPVIPVMDNIIVMPLVGSIDTLRARDIMRTLLGGIRQHKAKVVILDITGVPIMDSGVANHLNKTIQAARLKGATTVVTGISDAVAETIIDLGIDWSKVDTLGDLQTGLLYALNRLGVKLTKA
jgi:rsbT co-antagonist protein RsbR